MARQALPRDKPEPGIFVLAIVSMWALMAAGTAWAGDELRKAEVPNPPVRKASAPTGAHAFQKCAACHSLDASGASATGPNLYRVVGRKVGKLAGFHYSPVLAKTQDVWTRDRLDAFLSNPQSMYPGNRMPFTGIAAEDERHEVIEYIISMSK